MWIKICGVTTPEDARTVAASHADAIGLNFYAPSKRFLPPHVRNSVRDAIAENVEVVGVFVNSPMTDVARCAEETRLDTVQFHGDETPELVNQFHQTCPHIGIIRAFRIDDSGFHFADQWLEQATAMGIPLQAALIDAYRPGEYGGTGHQLSVTTVTSWNWPQQDNNNLILAGGLRPENISDAVTAIRPFGIDTASGVEDDPGRKNADAVKRFVDNARRAAVEPMD